MKAALLRFRMIENFRENEDHCAGWRPWIIESAGEPRIGTGFLEILTLSTTRGLVVALQSAPRR